MRAGIFQFMEVNLESHKVAVENPVGYIARLSRRTKEKKKDGMMWSVLALVSTLAIAAATLHLLFTTGNDRKTEL